MGKTALMSVLHNVVDDYPELLKKEILDAIGCIDHIEVFGQEVLVAPFIQAPRSRGGIIVSASSFETEDKWQGKSFLILKLGAEAISVNDKKGLKLEAGQWCWGVPTEHTHVSVRGEGSKQHAKNSDGTPYRPWGDAGWPCRMVLIGDIRGRTTRPQDIM